MRKTLQLARFAAMAWLIIAMTISLAACRKIDPISAETFKDETEKLGYTIVENTDYYSGLGFVSKCYSLFDDAFSVDFFEIDSSDNAVSYYKTGKDYIKSEKSGVSSIVEANTGAYSYYKQKSGDKYYVIIRVGTTMLYGMCPKTNAAQLDKFIKSIGY